MKGVLKWVGLALFLYILYQIDLPVFLNQLGKINWWVAVISMPLFFLPIYLKSLRWQRLLAIQNIDLPLSWAFQGYLRSIFWGMVTPGRVGELVKVHYLVQQGIRPGRAAVSVLVDRVLDLILLAGIAGLAMVTVLSEKHVMFEIPWVIIGVGLICVGALFFFPWRIRLFSVLGRIAGRLAPEYGEDGFEHFREDFLVGLKLYSGIHLIVLLLVTVGIWLIYSIPFMLLGLIGIGMDVEPWYLLAGIFFGTVVGLLPISMAGVGTRDWFFILYFGMVGLSSEQGVLFSFTFLYMYVVVFSFGWLLGSLKLRDTVEIKQLKRGN